MVKIRCKWESTAHCIAGKVRSQNPCLTAKDLQEYLADSGVVAHCSTVQWHLYKYGLSQNSASEFGERTSRKAFWKNVNWWNTGCRLKSLNVCLENKGHENWWRQHLSNCCAWEWIDHSFGLCCSTGEHFVGRFNQITTNSGNKHYII